ARAGARGRSPTATPAAWTSRPSTTTAPTTATAPPASSAPAACARRRSCDRSVVEDRDVHELADQIGGRHPAFERGGDAADDVGLHLLLLGEFAQSVGVGAQVVGRDGAGAEIAAELEGGVARIGGA